VITPKLLWVDNGSAGLKIIDKATGIVTFLRDFKNEACQNQISGRTAKSLVKAVVKTPINFKLACITGVASVGAFALGSPVAALSVLAVGLTSIFGVVPKIVDGGIETLSKAFSRWAKDNRKYIQQKFN
ncbi:MAG: hypothetical protein NZO16_07870, partial [Deltaproteobacteria bacterium]|nr:hypothetical protein [Deltaproteobacteria bacterium]